MGKGEMGRGEMGINLAGVANPDAVLRHFQEIPNHLSSIPRKRQSGGRM